jgi:hypothetical protein
MNPAGPSPTPHARLDALRHRLRARAAGWWRKTGDGLEQVAFAADADLPDDVALGFSGATRLVPYDRSDLGIVRAALTGEVAVSRASDLPADSGSGLWLRRLGAARSVAVPVRDGSGIVVRVVSLALTVDTPDDNTVAGVIRADAEGWPGD